MGQVIGIKFKDYGQVYYFDAAGHECAAGDKVIVETENGQGLGVVVNHLDGPPDGVDAASMKPMLRQAAPDDLETEAKNDALAKEAFAHCRQRIAERKLEMKLTDVEVYFDSSKIVFYFTAPGRVDFRELVKDLVRAYRTRIELRQIGVRHETQMLGAIGNCGQMCCCRRFLRKFAPVTIKMAKEQNLFLNPAKISGICGRLLCCLAYEQKNYEDFQKKCPKSGKRFSTSLGNVKVLRTNFFRQSISIFTEAGEERELNLDEWAEIRDKAPDPAIPGAPKQPAPPEAAHKAEGKPRDGRSGRGSRPPRSKEKGDGPERTGGRGHKQGSKGKRPMADAASSPAPNGGAAAGGSVFGLAEAQPGDSQDKTAGAPQAQADGEGKPKRKRPNRRRRRRKPKSGGGEGGGAPSGGSGPGE